MFLIWLFVSDTIAAQIGRVILFVVVRLIFEHHTMSYEDFERSAIQGVIGSVIIIFLGVSHDGWGKSLGCATQIWKYFRGWAFLAVIITIASYLAKLWIGGGDGLFGQQNGDGSNNDDNSSDNPPTPPGSPPPPKPPSKQKSSSRSPAPVPQPRKPCPCPSPSPRRPPSRRRTPTPEPEDPQEETCIVCGYHHAGGSHQW